MSVDQEIDELFALPPDRFTSSRDELFRRLTKEGDKEAAASVKALRKPTLVAWALNQLPRRLGKDLRALVEAGETLRTAQRRAASGAKDTGFQEASETRRRLVRNLTGKATGILSEAGKPSQAAEAEIARSLEAASVDVEAGDLLLAGRLSKAISTVPGFDSVGGFEAIAGTGGEQADLDLARDTTAARAALRNAERQASKAEADVRRARMRADTLAEEAVELRRRAEEAAGEADELERTAAQARRKLQRARREADES